jgi:hypothetical protein
VAINASASKVPTRAYKRSNQQLANARASRLQQKISEAVAAAGGQQDQLHFTRYAHVSGPKYRGDWDLGREKYQKHQYAKAKIR